MATQSRSEEETLVAGGGAGVFPAVGPPEPLLHSHRAVVSACLCRALSQGPAANDSLAPVSELQLVEETAGKRWELQEKGLFRVPLLLSFFSSRRRDPVVCIGQRPAGMLAARRAQERPGLTSSNTESAERVATARSSAELRSAQVKSAPCQDQLVEVRSVLLLGEAS